jgi:hypothetical protein
MNTSQPDILNSLPLFDRKALESEMPISRMGDGEIGGKAHGLLSILDLLKNVVRIEDFPEMSVSIPRMVVLTTEIFDHFMKRNGLYALAASDASDTRIADAFQSASFPVEYVGDLMEMAESLRTPIAVRSSSRLEDALYRPFAGVYGTKMIPNNQFSTTERFRCLVEAIKFVYATTYFREAKAYVRNTTENIEQVWRPVLSGDIGSRAQLQLLCDGLGAAEGRGSGSGYGFGKDGGGRRGKLELLPQHAASESTI